MSVERTRPRRRRDVPDKIVPVGQIHLGKRLRLEQHVNATVDTAFGFSDGLPEDGLISPFENPLPGLNGDAVPMQMLEYALEEDPGEDLYLADLGLVMSYGIFGAPGSGKTFLMMRMLRQLLALELENVDRKFGGLILDPKAALIEDFRAIVQDLGREDDLVVLNAGELEDADEYANVIDCDIESSELARLLVLAAKSAGVGASEDYWFGAWENLFSAAIYLLKWLEPNVLTMRDLLVAVLTVEPVDQMLSSAGTRRPVEALADKALTRVSELRPEQQPEARAAINQIKLFYSQKSDSIATVDNLITQAYGHFLRERTQRYSPTAENVGGRTTFYDEIIDDGKLVLVSVSPAEPGLAKVLCTLIKNLFMQSMRSRRSRVREGRLRNFERPVVLACDEYSQVASEIPGQVGDGDFFSIARAQGCMGLLATQSVNVLESSALKENWKAIFSNFAAKIFMRAVDNETVEQATKLAGELDRRETSLGSSSGGQGLGSSTQTNLKEHKVLPGYILTQLIEQGQGVVIGQLDGRSTPSTYFLDVPAD
jgi:type IV secretory pathway TraG/TraD family ATPase VirD4